MRLQGNGSSNLHRGTGGSPSTALGLIVLTFQSFRLCLFLSQISLNFSAVGVVVGQCREHLGKTEMRNRIGDLVGSQSLLIPADNPPHRDSRSCNSRTTAANLGRTFDQRADFG